MTHRKMTAGIVAGLAMSALLLSGCTQAPDMSGIASENQRPVKRYDIVQAVAANDKVVVAGTQASAALVSADQGKTWSRVPLRGSSLVDLTVCGKAGFLGIDHYHKVWFGDAEGKQWQSAPLEKPQTPIAVACDPQGGWWVAGTNATLAVSRDEGKTWTVTDLGEDTQITTLQFIDDKHGVALGEFGIAVYTEDGGATWKKGAKLPDDFYPYAALFRNRNEGWVSGIAGQVLVTRDGGKTWSKQANATQAALYRLFLHDGVPFAVGAGGVIAKLDGNTWRAVPYTDPLPVFLGGGTSLPGQSAVLIGGPGGLLRAVGTANKQ